MVTGLKPILGVVKPLVEHRLNEDTEQVLRNDFSNTVQKFPVQSHVQGLAVVEDTVEDPGTAACDQVDLDIIRIHNVSKSFGTFILWSVESQQTKVSQRQKLHIKR